MRRSLTVTVAGKGCGERCAVQRSARLLQKWQESERSEWEVWERKRGECEELVAFWTRPSRSRNAIRTW